MRNYIELNGQNSNEITGLLIQSLPPISQPKIRANIEEIDGRDGDIITKLGYSSYNKEISIGLYGDYDVDDVIAYFTNNQSGKVTFSNEPDKYYKYEILDEIDFERLIRFKTATVTMHIQPFKYSNEQGIKTFNISEETSVTIYNNGNYKSKPIIKITGSGTIEFKQEGIAVFTYTFPADDTYVVIDSDKQDAYVGSILKNRNMDGEFPTFKIGKNIISWTGTISKIEVSNYSRWL